jgi:serine/threonine-protein kinase HipA
LPLGTVGTIEAEMSLSVENEWLCSKLISAFGLKTAHCEIAEFAEVKALVIQRFDRNMHTGKIVRLPQEDFCQITGTSPHSKYESEGGPGIRTMMNILLGSTSSLSDRIDFYKSQIIFWLLAAPDGHAKNYSVFIRDAGRFQLTPIYDVISAYPVLGHGKNLIAPQRLNMAMAFTGKKKHYTWNKILPRHIVQTGNMCGLETRDVLEQVLTEVPRVLDLVSSLLPQGFPALVSDSILSGVQQQAEEAVKTL